MKNYYTTFFLASDGRVLIPHFARTYLLGARDARNSPFRNDPRNRVGSGWKFDKVGGSLILFTSGDRDQRMESVWVALSLGSIRLGHDHIA